MRRLAFLFGFALPLAAAGGARADDKSCVGVFFDDAPTLAVGRIKADAGKVHFSENGDGKNACPSPAPDCQDKAFLTPGDLVVLGAKTGDYVCVDYTNAKGGRSGWLPASAIELAPAVTEPADWAGRWKSVEAEIRIAMAGKLLKAEGDATFGALDPARAKHGAVNVGEFSSLFFVQNGQAVFSDQEVDPKDPDVGCLLRMTRAGDFLFVLDNMKCGGFNVSFTGMYRRAKK